MSVGTTQAVRRAIDYFGTQAALAAALEVAQPTISEWLSGRRKVPLARCPQIEGLTGVLCEDLRPDVAWHVLRRPPMSRRWWSKMPRKLPRKRASRAL